MGAEERGSELGAGVERESATHLPATETCVYLVRVRLDGISLRIGSFESLTPSVSFRAAPLIQSGPREPVPSLAWNDSSWLHIEIISYAVARAPRTELFLTFPFWSNFRQLPCPTFTGEFNLRIQSSDSAFSKPLPMQGVSECGA